MENASGLPLAVSRLSLLVSAALPVVVKGNADDGWRTFLENANAQSAPETSWMIALANRKSSLLLPEYAERYRSFQFPAARVRAIDHGSETEGEITAFVSLVRNRFLCVSLWLAFSEDPIRTPQALSSVWMGGYDLAIPGDSSFKAAFSLGGRSSELASSQAPSAALHGILMMFGGHLVSDQEAPHLHPGARFDATLALLKDPPDAFGKAALDDQTNTDWRLQAAELLPLVRGAAHDYRREFLLDALGIDVMDSVSGHYFLGRRRILALLDAAAPEQQRINLNILTWTQLLCENAAVQLAAIRVNNQRLQREIDEGKPLALTAQSLTLSQYRLYQDLDEAMNIAISLDPVFWHHQETLKRVSGLSDLARNLSERAQAFVSASSLEEQRVFASAAQALTIILGALALAAPTVQIGVDKNSSTETIIALAVGSVVLGALVGLSLVQLMAKRGLRRSPRSDP